MADLPIQRTMRSGLALLTLVLSLSLGASYATAASPGDPLTGSDDGCGTRFQSGCPFLCAPAPAIAQAREPIAAKPLPSSVGAANLVGAPDVVSSVGGSQAAALALGPPAYLSFRRLLL